MITEESKKLWGQRFRDRTHDAELYRIGDEADPKLKGTVYNTTWDRTPRMKDTERHKNAMETARVWVIWSAFESLTDSVMLDQYR